MIYVFYTLHIIVCMFLILVVLLQQGKGADLSVFGGGSTQTAFGARGAATLLHKLTVASFVIFIVTTMGIAVLSGGPGGASVMSESAAEEAKDLTTPGTPAEETATPPSGAAETPAAPAPEAPAPEGGGAPAGNPPGGSGGSGD